MAKPVIAVLAVALSLYQLYTAGLAALPAMIQRADPPGGHPQP